MGKIMLFTPNGTSMVMIIGITMVNYYWYNIVVPLDIIGKTMVDNQWYNNGHNLFVVLNHYHY